MGAAIDGGQTSQPNWQSIFEGYAFSRDWLKRESPDAIILVYNDHASAFSMDVIPTFAIGCAASFEPAETVWGRRPVPAVQGHPELAWHIAESVILDEFDVTIVNRMEVDHGLTVPLSLMFGQVDPWPCRVIPVAVNVLQFPPPTGNRCFQLGRAIRKAVDSFEDDIKVVVFGTGGMSHQLHGKRAGLINRAFDSAFLDRLGPDPAALARITHHEYVLDAGSEGIELIMWLVMRGALDDKVREVHRFHPEKPVSNTALGHLILENLRRD